MKEKKTLCNSDPRLRWLMEQALRYFQLKDESLAVNMLERHDGRAKKELHRLFAGSDNTPSIFYVYQTTYTKTFYKEVTLKKEVPRPHDSSPQTSDRERESEESGADDRKKKKDQKKKKKLMKKKVSKTASGDEGGGDDTDKEDKKETVGEEEQKPSEETKDEEMSAQEEDTGAGGTAEQMESDSKDEADSKKAKKTKKAKTPKSKKRPQSPASGN
ncbi:Hypothetical protein NTJ_03857 [Nesidiocoris tenuis]|uniref:Uncharacterized protein n=1 Tax=Nesidiocoris tenuis TaxID=355587 RepID=A0ABN7AIM1_9HEMI|nr:Hypothetical protein NTJ_03857 [Nesidiocoris tenuis]